MKLICCARCNEVFSLGYTYKECTGGHGGGMYIGTLNAKVWGPKELILVLGFANSSFVDAARAQLRDGDLKETMRYPGGPVTKGRDFTAFIIPESAPTVARFSTREEAGI